MSVEDTKKLAKLLFTQDSTRLHFRDDPIATSSQLGFSLTDKEIRALLDIDVSSMQIAIDLTDGGETIAASGAVMTWSGA